jgi:hypothetical protein
LQTLRKAKGTAPVRLFKMLAPVASPVPSLRSAKRKLSPGLRNVLEAVATISATQLCHAENQESFMAQRICTGGPIQLLPPQSKTQPNQSTKGLNQKKNPK